MRLAAATLALALLGTTAQAEFGEYGHRAGVHEFSVTGRVTNTEGTNNPPFPFLRQDEKDLLGIESLEESYPVGVGVEVQLEGRSPRRRSR